MIWGDIRECNGLLAWMGENDITFIDNVEILEKLSDLTIIASNRWTIYTEKLQRML